jgi:hypothetical protein
MWKLACGGGSGEHLPPDRLSVSQLASGVACLQAAAGIPDAGDAVAYEPTQRLLAVGVAKKHMDWGAQPPSPY